MRKALRAVRVLIPALCIVIVLIFLLPMPVSRTVPARMICLADESVFEEVTVTFRGHYRLNLFSKDSFSGKIIISGQPLSEDSLSTSLAISRQPVFENIMRYDTGPLDSPYGQLLSGRFFRTFAIAVFEPGDAARGQASFSYTDGTFIVKNTVSREDAVHALQKILET